MGFKQTNPRIGCGDRGICLDLEAKMVGGGGGFNFLWWWSCCLRGGAVVYIVELLST